jgi:hypothetical protein
MYKTSANLKTALHDISIAGWDSPNARDLLNYAERQLAGVARRSGGEPAEAVSYAYQLWTSSLGAVLAAENAWALTTRSVQNALEAERKARVRLTDVAALRTVAVAELEDSQFGHDAEVLESLPSTSSKPAFPAEGYNTPALRIALNSLTKTGLSLEVAEAVLDEMILTGSRAGSPAKAADLVRKEKEVPVALGIPREIWLATTRLLFGNPDGAMGLVEAVEEGIEPSAVKSIRNASAAMGRLAA